MEYSQTQASGNHRMIFASIFLIWGIAVAVGLPILFGLNNRYEQHIFLYSNLPIEEIEICLPS